MNRKTSTGQEFIQKLTGLVEINLKNEQFGVSELAKAMGISRSSLYVKVNAITQKSVSRFISEVRLKKARELLKQTSLTVSEIAYEVGFGSPTYFIKCFHDFYGLPPGEVEKAETLKNEFIDTTTRLQEPTLQKRRGKLRIAIVSILIIILFTVSIIVVNPFSSTKVNVDKSIAVLPFKNLSEDPENQYFADGMMEDIVHNLSLIAGFRVISVTSSQKYRNTNKSLPEIAKEVGVSYVLEGSVQKEGNNVKIFIQFNDAKKDKLVWSDSYNKELKDIFDLQSNIAGQIAKKLETVLSPQEKEQINKRYTENTEAYNLYLKGRFFWAKRTQEDLLKSVDYFSQAIKVDPNYSLAYAGLADSYFIMVWWKWYPWDKGTIKSKEYALKALSIDNHLSEAHTVLGGIADWFEKDWKTAEREFKLAIEYNPNFAVAHQYYGEYLTNRGDFETAIAQLNEAIRLNPNAPAAYRVRAGIFYSLGKYVNALNDTKKVSELNQLYLTNNMLSFYIFIRLGDGLKAIDELKTIISVEDPELDQTNSLNDIYSKKGINGIIHWTIDWLETKDFNDNKTGLFNDEGRIANLYALTGEWDSVFVHLDRYSKSNSFRGNSIKYNIDYKPLRNDPRFIALMKKMGLKDL